MGNGQVITCNTLGNLISLGESGGDYISTLTQIKDPLREKVKAVYDKNDRVVKNTDQLGNTYKY